MIRLILADDHELVRQGLRAVLIEAPDIEVIGEANGGNEACRLAAQLKPDVVLLDVSMPDMDGIQTAKRIKESDPEIRVIILTTFLDDGSVKAAIQAGAIGYLLKDVRKEDLFHAVREAAAGRPSLHPEAQRSLIAGISTPSPAASPFEDLTSREQDVLRLISSGHSNKEIARELGLTEGTVKGYVSSMLVKIGVSDRTQAALFAIKHGLKRS